jgi:hypothetical protein
LSRKYLIFAPGWDSFHEVGFFEQRTSGDPFVERLCATVATVSSAPCAVEVLASFKAAGIEVGVNLVEVRSLTARMRRAGRDGSAAGSTSPPRGLDV